MDETLVSISPPPACYAEDGNKEVELLEPACYAEDGDKEEELLEPACYSEDGDKKEELLECTAPVVIGEKKDKDNNAATKKTGKEMRREKRLKNEPQNFIGLGDGPSSVMVLDFAEARATELRSMMKALESKGKGKRVFQYLPNHMRRRAMSHNAKRLPRHLREQASKQIDEAAKKKRPPPSRKQRRKPSSLRKEYSRRHRENGWLETHLWHAKRMKMCSKYGLRVAEHCSDKGVRAAHRSLVHGCLLSDISYYQCYEISGQQSDIIACLSNHFDMDAGLTIKAKAYLKGQREGKAILYQAGGYPYGAIAPVHFLWQAPPPTPVLQPVSAGQEDCVKCEDFTPRTSSVQEKEDKEHFRPCAKSIKLWIWCHPASKEQVLSELLMSMNSYNKILQHQDPMSRVRQQVSVVHRNLVRFRLLGPRSHAVLMETLKPKFKDDRHGLAYPLGDGSQSEESLDSDGDGDDEEEGEDERDSIDHIPPAEKWWLEGELKTHILNHTTILTKEYPAIKKAVEPAEFARGSVVGLCVEDPRLFTPSKKTDMVSSYYPQKKKLYTTMAAGGDDHDQADEVGARTQSSDLSASGNGLSTLPDCLSSEISFSPLWDKSVSDTVSRSLIPCHHLNRRRSKKLIRSKILKLGDSAPCIPVLLIQQTPQHSSSASPSSREYMGTGWDLILPPEWAMAFWISLIYRGARVCGMKELAKASMELQVLHFPQDYPDTVTSNMFYSDKRIELETRFARKPPKNRLNYGKLVVPTPFHIPWEDLMRFWMKRDVQYCTKKGTKRSADHLEINLSGKKAKLEDGIAECIETLTSDDFEDVMLDSTVASENVYAMVNQSYYVMRSKDALNSLRLYISTVLAKKTQSAIKLRTFSEDHHREVLAAMWKYAIDDLVQSHGRALVAVAVEISVSGNLASLDCLSLPSLSDLRSLLPEGTHGFSGPTEEMNQRGMTIVEKGTVTIGISSLTRQKIREQKTKEKGGGSNGGLVNNYQLFSARPSRPILGYVTSAGHRLTTSVDSGIGFVTVTGLIEAVTRCHATGHTSLQVLARGAKTKYYFVKLNVL